MFRCKILETQMEAKTEEAASLASDVSRLNTSIKVKIKFLFGQGGMRHWPADYFGSQSLLFFVCWLTDFYQILISKVREYYIGVQRFMTTLSYSLAQKLWVLYRLLFYLLRSTGLKMEEQQFSAFLGNISTFLLF